MLKPLRQAKSFFSAIRQRVNKDLKNLKISPAVHQRLKIQAAEHAIPISEYADILLALAMSETKAWNGLREDAIALYRKTHS